MIKSGNCHFDGQGNLSGQTTVNSRRSVSKNSSKNRDKKCCLYLDIFSCVKINVFRSFFAFMLEMHVRCDKQYKTGADRGAMLEQPVLFECIGICVLSPAHESKMRGYLFFLLFYFWKHF